MRPNSVGTKTLPQRYFS